MKPLVYVAAPYTRPDPIVNTRRAVAVGDQLVRDGLVTPILPHLTMLWHTIIEHDIDWWYAYDTEVLLHCDALLRLDGASTGADAEVTAAVKAGIYVFLTIDDLYRWARKEAE